jgi:hypothetical protein
MAGITTRCSVSDAAADERIGCVFTENRAAQLDSPSQPLGLTTIVSRPPRVKFGTRGRSADAGPADHRSGRLTFLLWYRPDINSWSRLLQTVPTVINGTDCVGCMGFHQQSGRGGIAARGRKRDR